MWSTLDWIVVVAVALIAPVAYAYADGYYMAIAGVPLPGPLSGPLNQYAHAADAEAICEAASRPKLRKTFVPIKTPEQQSTQMLMKLRAQFIGRRTQIANAMGGVQ